MSHHPSEISRISTRAPQRRAGSRCHRTVTYRLLTLGAGILEPDRGNASAAERSYSAWRRLFWECFLLKQRWILMPESYCRPEPSLIPIKPPQCPKCQGRMMLTRIEHNPNGHVVRIFDCVQCEYVQKLLIEYPAGTRATPQQSLKLP